MMPRTRKKINYRVINIRPRLTKKEERRYIEEVLMPTFIKLDLYKVVDKDYKPKPIREIPIDELGDDCESAKQFLREHPEYMAFEVVNDDKEA